MVKVFSRVDFMGTQNSENLTSIANVINIIKVDLFGVKVIVSGSNRVIQSSIRSIFCKDYSVVTIFLMRTEEFVQLIFCIEWSQAWFFVLFVFKGNDKYERNENEKERDKEIKRISQRTIAQ